MDRRGNNVGRPSFGITKEMCLEAMKKTKSIRAASRYLGVSYDTGKKYFRIYKDDETGKTLYELQSNQSGKGIKKHVLSRTKPFAILDILEGRVNISSFNSNDIKDRLISEGYLEQKCYNCGFCERRVLDYKAPLLLNFRDKNKNNWKLNNLEMLCYNCYFLYWGNIFSEGDIRELEQHKQYPFATTEESKFQLDDYHFERLKELGLSDGNNDDDGEEYISRKT